MAWSLYNQYDGDNEMFVYIIFDPHILLNQ